MLITAFVSTFAVFDHATLRFTAKPRSSSYTCLFLLLAHFHLELLGSFELYGQNPRGKNLVYEGFGGRLGQIFRGIEDEEDFALAIGRSGFSNIFFWTPFTNRH